MQNQDDMFAGDEGKDKEPPSSAEAESKEPHSLLEKMERDLEDLEGEAFEDEDFGGGDRERGRLFRRGVLTGIIWSFLVFTALVLILFRVYTKRFSGSILNIFSESKVNRIATMIDDYYYEDVDSDKMAEGLYKGVVESLDDPYSAYYTPEEYKELLIDATGSYAGIGAVLGKDETTGEVTVRRVYEGSPAEKAGLRDGDRLIEADGYSATDLDLDEFVAKVRGVKGTDVSITYERGKKQYTVSVTRNDILVPTVEYRMLTDEIGYINILEFASGTERDFKKAIRELDKKGMKAVVYDLRQNPGGLVDSVTSILDEILPEGTTVFMKDKKGRETDFTSDDKKQMHYPIAVLTSKNTASAAEIFAGAIRDFDYGTLIGVNTYGKGIVQQTIPMDDGSALKLTIETYYTPNGENIHKKGIAPDIELEYKYTGDVNAEEYDYSKDNQVQRAVRVLKKELETANK